MAKYKFRLNTLQKVREAKRDQHRASLADAFRAEQILTEKRAEVTKEKTELVELQRSAATGQYLDVNRLLEAQRYEILLQARGHELAKQTALVEAETERRRQSLVEADRDVRALELLDERHRREHSRRAARQDVKQLDETAIHQWRRL